MDTLMWEARAAAGRIDELVAWLLGVAEVGEVFRSTDHVVLIMAATERLPEPPAELLARPPHSWQFERVR